MFKKDETSYRSAFSSLVLADGHYDILCTAGYGALAEQGTPMRRLFHCFMTREYLAVLSSRVFSPPCAAGSIVLRPGHNTVREVLLFPLTSLFLARSVDGAAHSAVVLSALPSQTARKKEDGREEEEARVS